MLLLNRVLGRQIRRRDLSQFVLFSHFGWMPTNIPRLTRIKDRHGNLVRGPLIPEGSSVTLLSRDPMATLMSLYQWYLATGMIHNNHTIPRGIYDFVLSDFGAGELIRFRKLVRARIEKADRGYDIKRAIFEDTFHAAFIGNELPMILNMPNYRPTVGDIAFVRDGSNIDKVKLWARHEPGEMPNEYRYLWDDLSEWDERKLLRQGAPLGYPDLVPPGAFKKLNRKLWWGKWL